MAYEHKPGTFSLFKNDKGGNEKRPDYTGLGKDLDGQEIEVSAWLKDGSKGKFMSCNFKVKQARGTQAKPTREPGDDEDEDKPPF